MAARHPAEFAYHGARLWAVLCACLFFPHPVFAESSRYPLIEELSARDPVFLQYSDDVAASRMALAAAKPDHPLSPGIYAYTARAGDSLLSIAARCAVPYDSIASLNRISSIKTELEGRLLMLPTLPGLYIPDSAQNALEALLLSSFDPNDPTLVSFALAGENGVRHAFHCLPGANFDGTVRTFFLVPGIRFPLPESRVTSTFGMRKNPVTGNLVFHNGIDLAAPRGTPVFACAAGAVRKKGYDPIYGNFVILSHDGNRESLYGHLESIKIELHDKIKSGTILGTVGSTGQSTGPHLHFEIHENGIPKDPAGLLRGY